MVISLKRSWINMGTAKTTWTETAIEHHGNNTSNKKCVVVIPVYRKEPNVFEKASLKQVVNILGSKYELVLICPKSLDISNYDSTVNYNFSVLRCSDCYFKSQRSYSDLCEVWQLYNAFSEYEFMIIYQLDAWIFEDKLDYFMNLGYDYIGAPHLVNYGGNGIEGRNGNGGFCLRKIKTFIDVCKNTDFSSFGLMEDRVFTETLKNKFKLAPINICREFSFQDVPEICFKLNGNKLPMGCHKFMHGNYRGGFWRNYIKIPLTKEIIEEERKLNLVSVRLMGGCIDGVDDDGLKNKRFIARKRRVIRKTK